jgi:hypothetical protein
MTKVISPNSFSSLHGKTFPDYGTLAFFKASEPNYGKDIREVPESKVIKQPSGLS